MIEPQGKIFGLIKFFREEWKLDALINGCVYCNTPEFYRMSGAEGVSDRFESCRFSYRSSRKDEPIFIKFNGVDLSDVSGLTIHSPGDGDAWMHCWYVLLGPENQTDLDELKVSIERMKLEFGNLYAFIPADKIEDFYHKLTGLTEKKIRSKKVTYNSDMDKWGTFCKSSSYEYQREYRFSVGKCEPHSTEEYVITATDGFPNMVFKNPEIKIQHNITGEVWFEINTD